MSFTCNKCKKETTTIVYSRTLDQCVCKECKQAAGDHVRTERNGIFDATGKRRDREWLNDKLHMTRTDKNWMEDIKSRRIMPDGTVRRIKRKLG